MQYNPESNQVSNLKLQAQVLPELYDTRYDYIK